jgi:hypothetical protein
MDTMSSTTLWAALGAALAGAGVAFALARAFYGALLRDANAKTERALRAKAQANELLLQARRHAELMQKELVQTRRQRPAAARPIVAPLPVPEAVHDDEPPATGFAATMPFTG